MIYSLWRKAILAWERQKYKVLVKEFLMVVNGQHLNWETIGYQVKAQVNPLARLDYLADGRNGKVIALFNQIDDWIESEEQPVEWAEHKLMEVLREISIYNDTVVRIKIDDLPKEG